MSDAGRVRELRNATPLPSGEGLRVGREALGRQAHPAATKAHLRFAKSRCPDTCPREGEK